MRFTNEAIERIDKAKVEWQKNNSIRFAEGINIRNDIFGTACVYKNDNYLFEVSDMWKVINELNAMADIVKDAVGIYEEV